MRSGLPDPNRNSIVRETNRDIRTHLRDDWDWPLHTSSQNRIERNTPWRKRESSPSSPEPESSDPYKYDTPDSVAEMREGRKRKRKERFVEELAWNEGLKTFVQRRNTWTGGGFSSTASIGLSEDIGPLTVSSEAPASPLAGPENSMQAQYSSSKTTPPGLPTSPSSATEIVPLPAPIISASNPIRANITPAAYRNIYNKVVVQGITPKIPINLADMTTAITEGWKANGEWPPAVKVAEVVPIARRKKGTGKVETGQSVGNGQERAKRRSLTMRGVGRVKKALGLKEDVNGNGDSATLG